MSQNLQGQLKSFAEMEAMVLSFDGTLTTIGVKDVHNDHPLHAACLDAIRILELHSKPSTRDPHEDIRQVIRPVLGLWTLISKTVRLRGKPGFDAFAAHFQQLVEGVVWQNEKYIVRDQASDKIFELIFGLSVFEIAQRVVVDDPVHSAGGTNPDIIADIGPDRWGFACKVVSGDSGKALYDNLEKAVQQIRDCAAAVGIPVINFRDLIPHDALFWPMLNPYEWEHEHEEPRYFTWPDQRMVFNRLREFASSQRLRAEVDLGLANIFSLYNGQKSLPGFLAYMQTSCGIVIGNKPVPCDIRDMSIQQFVPFPDEKHVEVLQAIHKSMHDR